MNLFQWMPRSYADNAFWRITIRASSSARARSISPSRIIPVSAMASARRAVRAGDPRNLFPALLGTAVERVAAEQYLVRPFRDPLAKRTGKLRRVRG